MAPGIRATAPGIRAPILMITVLVATFCVVDTSSAQSPPYKSSKAAAAHGVTYSYDDAGRLAAVVYGDTLRMAYTYDAGGNVVGVNTESTVAAARPMDLPQVFSIHANYPNPFNPQTVIRYDVPRASQVELAIYDILGRRVKLLFAGEQSAGYHSVIWDGLLDSGVEAASGVYLYRLRAADFSQTRKMLLMR